MTLERVQAMLDGSPFIHLLQHARRRRSTARGSRS